MFDGIKRWAANQIANQILEAERQTWDIGDVGVSAPQVGWYYGEELEQSPEQFFKSVTEEDLFKLTVSELSKRLVKSDPTISRIYDDFITMATLEIRLTCENPRGQQILDDLQTTLSQKRNSLNAILSKIFGSILLRGTYCFELTLDEMRRGSNIFVVDPDSLYFRSRPDKVDGEIWDLIQYSRRGKVVVLSPDRVFYDGVNPLLGELKGHSMIAPAFPSAIGSSLMLKDLREVLEKHAYVRRFLKINDIAMKQAGYSPADINTRITKSAADIKKHKRFLKDPGSIPTFLGDVELNQVDGASTGSGMQFVETIDRILERKSIRGGGAMASNLNSNEYAAESSARIQALRGSAQTGSFQGHIETEMSRALSMPLQAVGITEPAVLALKRTDVMERDYEADVFNKIAAGIKNLTDAGLPLGLAFELFSEMTNVQIPAELKAKLEKLMGTEGGTTE